MSGDAGVMGRMLRVAVAEVVLRGPEINAFVGKIIAAGVTQHVRPDAAQFCVLACERERKRWSNGLPGAIENW
jgi:hypothetical protein